jgi:hypothetical protein
MPQYLTAKRQIRDLFMTNVELRLPVE